MRFTKTIKVEDLTPYAQGHDVERPINWLKGVIFASPHSGSIYPKNLIKRSKLSGHQLRRNEDIFIDRLFGCVPAEGAPFLKALFPRVVVDVNRSADELSPQWSSELGLDPAHPTTPRALAGLGVIPTALTETLDIYSHLPTAEEVKARLDTLYHPYHKTVRALINESLNRFGQALLVDCHSMPGFAPMGARRPDIILGDRFGTSCRPNTLAQFRALFSDAGYNVGVNYPYAGGYTTSHYGCPNEGVETIQIEINRDLYVNPITLLPKTGYAKLSADLGRITQSILQS